MKNLTAIFVLGMILIPTLGLAKDKDPLHVIVEMRESGGTDMPDHDGTRYDSYSKDKDQQRRVRDEVKDSANDHDSLKIIALMKKIRKSEDYKAKLQSLKDSIKDCPAAPGFATAPMSTDLTLNIISHPPKSIKSYRASLEFPVSTQSGNVVKEECPINNLIVPYKDAGTQTFIDRVLNSIQDCADANKKACAELKDKVKQTTAAAAKPIAPPVTAAAAPAAPSSGAMNAVNPK